MGRRLTSDVYDAYAYKLGLGQRTGVEVNEAVGRLTKKTDKNYTSSLDIQAAIGQGNTVVSPIQLATYAATLANNGVRYRTHFVKAILDTNTGEVLSETQPEVMDIIEGNGNTFELVRQGMKQVPSTISGKLSHCHRLQDRHPPAQRDLRFGQALPERHDDRLSPGRRPGDRHRHYGGVRRLRCPYR